jgi:hypothetical protein
MKQSFTVKVENLFSQQSSVFFKLCENDEERTFFQIRPPGSLTELAPMRPSKMSGMAATVEPGDWGLFV